MRLLTHLAMIGMCLAVDAVYVKWVRACARGRPYEAALYSVLCVLFGQASTILCVHDYWLLCSACIGHALGTLLTVGSKADG